MTEWFTTLYAGWVAGYVNLGGFPFGAFFVDVLWNALALFLPILAITALALFAVNLVFPRSK